MNCRHRRHCSEGKGAIHRKRLSGSNWRIAAACLAGGAALSNAAPATAADCVFGLMPVAANTIMPAIKGDRFILEKVRGAAIDRPFVLESQANGEAWLNWQRLPSPTKVSLFQRLMVLVRRQGDPDFATFCETDWTEVALLGTRRQLALPAIGPAIWRVEVLEDNRTPKMTVLEDERGQLILGGSLVGEPTVIPKPAPWFAMVRSKPAAALASCSVSDQAAVADAMPVTSARVLHGGLQIPGTAYVLSGGTLHLKINRIESGPPISVALSAKPVGLGIAPIPVCSIQIAAGTLKEGEWVSASTPWQPESEFRWYIGLTSEGMSPEFTYEAHRERPAMNSAQGHISYHATDVYSCADAPEEAAWLGSSLKAEMFEGAYALTIRTNMEPLRLPADSYRRIVEALLTSINSWRMVCTSCSPYQFSIIDIDGKIYVAAGMLQGWPGNFRASFRGGYPWNPRLTARKSVGAFNTADAFIPVEMSAMQRQRFCVQTPEKEFGFDAAQSPLCRPSPPSSEKEMVVNFEWNSDVQSCTGESEVVACWNGGERIQMNVRDYSFYVGDVGTGLVGTGAKGADLVRVFIHEVGHWLGLGHMIGDGNIMSSRLSSARCIDTRNLELVNSVARGDTERRREAENLHYD